MLLKELLTGEFLVAAPADEAMDCRVVSLQAVFTFELAIADSTITVFRIALMLVEELLPSELSVAAQAGKAVKGRTMLVEAIGAAKESITVSAVAMLRRPLMISK